MEKVLIIDDSRLQAEFLKSIIQDDYDISICNTAEDGFSTAVSGDFSLILLDVVLPGMDGFTLLKDLQENAATRYTPVILITSLEGVHNEQKGLIMGAVDYITKPFNATIVRARVNTHVKLHRYRIQFEKQALVDELTGVANRRSYRQNSVEKWREALRLHIPFSVCMMDVDKFKVYNDTFGHPAGDRVLASVAKAVASCVHRSTDFFARYGGEEFALILLGDEGQKAFEFVRSVRQAVEDLHLPHDPSVSQWVTVSIGGATMRPEKEDSYDECLKRADAMLYEAKRSGRNRVMWLAENGEEWKEK